MKILAYVLIVASALTLPGCQRSPSHAAAHPTSCSLSAADGAQTVAVHVSAKELVESLVRQQLRRSAVHGSGQTPRAKSGSRLVEPSAMQIKQAIQQTSADALWTSVAAARGISISQKQLDQEMQRVLKEVFIDDANLMHEAIALGGWTDKAYRDHMRAAYLYRKLHLTDVQAQRLTGSLRGKCTIDGKSHIFTTQDALSVFQARPRA